MSGTVKVTQVKLGDSADPTKNFQINVPAVPDGTLTIERGDGTDVMKFLAGSGVDMPNLPFLKTSSGYMTLPNGLIVQWGDLPGADAGGLSSASFPVPFPTNVLQAVVTHVAGARNSVVVNITSLTSTVIQVGCSLSSTGAAAAGAGSKYIAIGY